MKVYIVIYSDHLNEEWNIEGVFSDKEAAHKSAYEASEDGKYAHLYHVEAHEVDTCI